MSLPSISPADLAKLPRWEKAALLSRLEPKSPANEATAGDLTRYRNEPVVFCREVLGVEPWAKQQEIMATVAAERRVTVRACHNSGKTWAAACLIHWFTRCFSPSLVVTTAPTARQVEKVLWAEIRRLHAQAGLPGDLIKDELRVSATQRAIGLTTTEPEKFQGWHEQNILLVVDEASGVEEAIYDALRGCLTGPNPKLLLIGNPNSPAGTFYDSHRSELYRSFRIQASDVPEWLLPPRFMEEAKLEWGIDSPAYRVRVEGEFPDQADDALISLAWVNRAQEADLPAEGEIVLGLDVARFGSDESYYYVRQGPKVIDFGGWRGKPITETAGRVAAVVRSLGVRLVNVDDPGIGGGATDVLTDTFRTEKGIAIVGVNVGEAARDKENYFNRRTELYCGLRDRLKSGDIDLPAGDGKLLAQLTSLRYSYTPRGQMKLEAKDDMKKRGLPSPDRADALMLAFATAGNRWKPVSIEAPVWEPKW